MGCDGLSEGGKVLCGVEGPQCDWLAIFAGLRGQIEKSPDVWIEQEGSSSRKDEDDVEEATANGQEGQYHRGGNRDLMEREA